MRGGGDPQPRSAKVKAGEAILAEEETADEIVLVLDGMVEWRLAALDWRDSALVPSWPSVLRLSRAGARRSAPGDCRIVFHWAAALPLEDLREPPLVITGKVSRRSPQGVGKVILDGCLGGDTPMMGG